MAERYRIVLEGCTPEPLAGYLKALGVLRLVALQKDPGVRGGWGPGGFYLDAGFDGEELVQFFLTEYRPSPVLAPWNGGSGFWDRTAAGQALARLRASTSPRLVPYREALARAEAVLQALGIRSKPKPDEKARLLRALRSHLPDDALPWLDAVAVLTEGDPRYAPLLGSGGNDGRLDFTANFIQHLERVLPFADPPATPTPPRGRRGGGAGYDPDRSRAWLEDALFARGRPPLVAATGGQYHPGSVGGPNATRGFEGQNLVNPWDFILLIEGALAFAGAAVRRYGVESGIRASFPFTVDVSPVGSGTAAEGEVEGARGEIWVPIWSQPAPYPVIQHLLAEGRAQTGRRQARTGVDFSRAVAGLGVDRGIDAFYRYGLLSRNGRAYLAAPLGRLEVRQRPHVHLIDELDPWLEAWRRFCQAGASARMARALREMEAAIFAYCAEGSRRALQAVLAAVGRAERALATSPRAEGQPWPLQDLSMDWLTACDDESPEFRLAAAVASLWDEAVGSLRLQLEPVEWKVGRYRWAGEGRPVAWGPGDLFRNLAAVLERRVLAAWQAGGRAVPNQGRCPARLADVHALLQGHLETDRMADLLWGLMTLRWDRPVPVPGWPRVQEAPADLSRAYALLKLTFWPGGLPLGPGGDRVAIAPDLSILHRLLSGDLPAALGLAARRLWAAGFGLRGMGRRGPRGVPDYAPPPAGTLALAAALIIPVSGLRHLARMVLDLPEESAREENRGRGAEAI